MERRTCAILCKSSVVGVNRKTAAALRCQSDQPSVDDWTVYDLLSINDADTGSNFNFRRISFVANGDTLKHCRYVMRAS